MKSHDIVSGNFSRSFDISTPGGGIPIETSILPSSKRGRLAFIDQVRTLAIVMMLAGHSFDRFLAEPWRTGEIYQRYLFVRGLSSSLFLTIAGFSFVISTVGRLDEYVRWTAKSAHRARRIALIFFLGLILQLPGATLYSVTTRLTPANLEYLFAFNVLQNIGFGLLLLHILLLSTRTLPRFRVAAILTTIAILAVGPIAYDPATDPALPIWLRGAFNLSHVSRFPIVPYSAFVCMGAVFGTFFFQHRGAPSEPKVFLFASAVGVLLIGTELLIRNIPGGMFPYYAENPTGVSLPGNTFARGGLSLLIISGIYLFSRYRVVLAEFSQLMSKNSLPVYFVHLFLVYGGIYFPGFFRDQRTQMIPQLVFLFIIGLVALMTVMAKLFDYLGRNRKALLQRLQRTALFTVIVTFFFFKYISPVSIAAVFLAVSTLIAFAPKFSAILETYKRMFFPRQPT